MSNRFTEVLIELYDADQWLRPEKRAVRVYAFGFPPLVLGGLEPQGIQRYATPPSVEVPVEQEQQRPAPTTAYRFFDGEALVVLTSYECDSREAARAMLLKLLGGFEVKSPVRSDAADLGEIAFVIPNHRAGAMVRGNMAFYAHNGAPETRDVVPLLQAIDIELTREPRGDDDLDVRVGPPAPGIGVRQLEMPALLMSAWYRFVAHGGEVTRSEDTLFFTPDSDADGAVLFVEQISPGGIVGIRIEIP